MRHEVMEIIEKMGLEVNLRKVSQVVRKANTTEEAVRLYLADESAQKRDPDMEDYMRYNDLIAKANGLAKCRGEVADTMSAEDIAAGYTADAERAEYTAHIAKLMEEAKKHLDGAKRWATFCRVELRELVH